MDGGLYWWGMLTGFELLVAAVAAFAGLVVYLLTRRASGLHPYVPVIVAALVFLGILVVVNIVLALWGAQVVRSI